MKTLKHVQGDGTEMNGATHKSPKGDFTAFVGWTDEVQKMAAKNSLAETGSKLSVTNVSLWRDYREGLHKVQ
ncbi:hypothetical protein [Roseivirga sp.]|uniref:hypothetical protein n=1 Tax=Roseivirga sp. TaxID=1964215 RepID=UPI003B52E6C5